MSLKMFLVSLRTFAKIPPRFNITILFMFPELWIVIRHTVFAANCYLKTPIAFAAQKYAHYFYIYLFSKRFKLLNQQQLMLTVTHMKKFSRKKKIKKAVRSDGPNFEYFEVFIRSNIHFIKYS